jgi:hypothetical protein
VVAPIRDARLVDLILAVFTGNRGAARNGFGEPRDRKPKSTLSRPRPAAETARPVFEPGKRPYFAGYSSETRKRRFASDCVVGPGEVLGASAFNGLQWQRTPAPSLTRKGYSRQWQPCFVCPDVTSGPARHAPSAPARWLHPADRDLHNTLAVEARYANSILPTCLTVCGLAAAPCCHTQ